MLYVESVSADPFYNLALEQYLFDTLPAGQTCLMLWQNDNAVIVGKHQNTVEEINSAYIKEHSIKVARRLSGGGAVFHDLGNINYTFIADAKEMCTLNLQAFCIPLVHALKQLDVPAEISGRNDVTINGLKCSGNSQYIKNGRVMHHGCILFDADLSAIQGALNVKKDKIISKGIKSVRSRVTNIKPFLNEDITINEFKNQLKQYMVVDAELKTYELTQKEQEKVEQLRDERYSTWEWNYGAFPEYQIKKRRRIEGCGLIEISMEIEHGNITAFACCGDYFGSGESSDLEALLVGLQLNENVLREKLQGVPIDYYFNKLDMETFLEILLQ